jgi:hypothetical protein
MTCGVVLELASVCFRWKYYITMAGLDPGLDPAIQQARVGAPMNHIARQTPRGWMGGSGPPMVM